MPPPWASVRLQWHHSVGWSDVFLIVCLQVSLDDKCQGEFSNELFRSPHLRRWSAEPCWGDDFTGPLAQPKSRTARDDAFRTDVEPAAAGVDRRLLLAESALLARIEIETVLALPRVFQHAPADRRTEDDSRVLVFQQNATGSQSDRSLERKPVSLALLVDP